jgi:hypothetical protein
MRIVTNPAEHCEQLRNLDPIPGQTGPGEIREARLRVTSDMRESLLEALDLAESGIDGTIATTVRSAFAHPQIAEASVVELVIQRLDRPYRVSTLMGTEIGTRTFSALANAYITPEPSQECPTPS